MTDHVVDIAVVGAGLAGLAAGATAVAQGRSAVVLEAHQVGGRARVVRRGDAALNMGAHALYRGGAGRSVLRSLGVDPSGSSPPLSQYRVRLDGALHALPTGPSALVRTSALGAREKVALTGVLIRMGTTRPTTIAGISIGAWLDRLELAPRVDAIARAVVRLSTYASDLHALSADAALRQMQLAVRGGVLYLHGGWSAIYARLQELVEVRTGDPVTAIDTVAGGVELQTGSTTVRARSAVVATGTPDAMSPLLGGRRWDTVGDPVTAACLDVVTRRVPAPGYVLDADRPMYVTVQSPPGAQVPAPAAVVAALRYGARSADEDRPELESLVALAGVHGQDVCTSRFLASMTVSGGSPDPEHGGLSGRPRIDASGLPGVFVAGDWIGPEGLIADAALKSGHDAGLAAAAWCG